MSVAVCERVHDIVSDNLLAWWFHCKWENGWGQKSGSWIVEKVQNLLFRDGFVFTFRLSRGVVCKKRPQKSKFQRILSRPMSCQLFLRSKNKKIRTFLENFYGSWWYPVESLHLWLHAPLNWKEICPVPPLACGAAWNLQGRLGITTVWNLQGRLGVTMSGTFKAGWE